MRKFVMISCGAKFKPHPKTSNREKEVQSTKFWCIGQQKEQDNYLFRRHFTTFLCLLLSRNTNDMGILLSNFLKIQVAFIDICSIHFGAHGKSDCDGIGRNPGILSEH